MRTRSSQDVNRPWSPDRAVSEAQARALIEDQFPTLVPVTVTPFGAGWDNTVFLVNEVYVFRFPRREIAVACMEAEIRVLPGLVVGGVGRLPLAIPVPTFVGQPQGTFPWPFAGYRLIEGRIVPSARLDERQRAAAAEPLARFLAALHAITAQQAAQLGAEPDTIGRLDLHKRVPRAREHLEKVSHLGLVDEPGSLETVLDETEHWLEAHRVSSPVAPSLVHGDFDSRHLLVDGQGEPCGVIDWGDVHVGDPAVDLAIAHSFLPPLAHETFRSAYGPIDERTWRLARFRALYQALLLIIYSHDIGDDDVLRESLTALRYVGG